MDKAYSIIDLLYKMQRDLCSDQIEVQRVVYESFGVSWLDGLDLFDKFSPNYCLMKVDKANDSSYLARELRRVQGHLKNVFRNEHILHLWRNQDQWTQT
eukprot:CAMPEP_0185594200 /NCGR_PEP_ID=MMETSP0434-20130131/73973_1 /TAXON_ID=626734 ORGANISM="Favella taraikaensis, Strain Fe Narragansett Bay" /NCGR_SAMPLE_ID=MMETSP0434 /ASSEMBLY_ACC=CAM_ASM_000379 /LENGTH=98 /DNA_ID=CAMNT_0028221331 /DNA_START=337 /DNA_END=633 /DNA_ORIENTATION=+